MEDGTENLLQHFESSRGIGVSTLTMPPSSNSERIISPGYSTTEPNLRKDLYHQARHLTVSFA